MLLQGQFWNKIISIAKQEIWRGKQQKELYAIFMDLVVIPNAERKHV